MAVPDPESDELGAPVGQPVVVVDLDRTTPAEHLGGPGGLQIPGGRRVPGGWPCVVIATSAASRPPQAPVGPDVFISAAADPPPPWVGVANLDEEIRVVEAAIRRNPQAATTLAQVLRVSSALGPTEALVVESLAYSTLQAGTEHQRWLAGRRHRAPDSRTDPAARVERTGDALSIMLDRPERRNAYSARMRDDLVVALELAAADPSLTSVHLRGRGPAFSSGGDLAEFGTLADPATAHGIRTLRSAGWWISQLAPRVTVHLQGTCVGAGIELAAFAGRVEAAADTIIILPEVGMGLIPGAGGTASIPPRIGSPRTAWLALTGSPLDATTAHRWGLIDRLLPPTEAGQTGV